MTGVAGGNGAEEKTGPMVMAYIGSDDPTRGDSRGSEGLARTIAEMLEGRYVYVDAAMLKDNFPELPDIQERLHAYLARQGRPDIVLGTHAYEFNTITKSPAKLQVSALNEFLSGKILGTRSLVSHHLTPALLRSAGAEFTDKYPDVKGPLIALMLACPFATYRSLAKKMAEIGGFYPEATFFICPGRHTGDAYKILEENLLEEFTRPGNPAPGNKIEILHMDFKNAKTGYNPYTGLLARADHIVIAGNSHSLVSEALYTGKNIYLYEAESSTNEELKRQGYTTDVMKLDSSRPFPTKSMPPLNVTPEVAKKIVRDYQEMMHFNTPMRKSAPRAQPVAEKFNFLSALKKFAESYFHPAVQKPSERRVGQAEASQ